MVLLALMTPPLQHAIPCPSHGLCVLYSRDLYSRWHRNTIQRDLMDQGLFVASDTGQPATQYADTDPSAWDGADLPGPTDDAGQLRADMADWGYCLVKEAVSPEQLEQSGRERLWQGPGPAGSALRPEFHPKAVTTVALRMFLRLHAGRL